MKKYLIFLFIFFVSCSVGDLPSNNPLQKGNPHLFILSGQSNMLFLDEDRYFTPIVQQELGNVIVVKQAKGGASISEWFNEGPQELYDILLDKVYEAIARLKEPPASITFVWMQGESDANQYRWPTYEEKLIGLIDQLEYDLDTQINIVIGRLGIWGILNPNWKEIRKIQVRVAHMYEGRWINTDDLGEYAHYDRYDKLGKRFAWAAIDLIAQQENL